MTLYVLVLVAYDDLLQPQRLAVDCKEGTLFLNELTNTHQSHPDSRSVQRGPPQKWSLQGIVPRELRDAPSSPPRRDRIRKAILFH
jgi:hypothetical protein